MAVKRKRRGYWKGKKFSPAHKRAISRAIKAWWKRGRKSLKVKKGGSKRTRAKSYKRTRKVTRRTTGRRKGARKARRK